MPGLTKAIKLKEKIVQRRLQKYYILSGPVQKFLNSPKTVTTIIDAFMHGYLSHFAVPQVITTDQGEQFESLLFSQFLQFLACQRNRTTVVLTISNLMVWLRIHIQD